MKIEFHCKECGGLVASEDQFRGEVIRCPHCERELIVPLSTIGPGAIVAGFKIVRQIGVGGMGSVYLAEQTSMGRQVALKVLPPAFTRDQAFLDRFLKEIRLQGSLSHPHIATAYDAGQFDDVYYLAMEYVEGEDLYDRITEDGQIEERVALRIIRKAASGLTYAWSRQGLIHRDIKPGNIMIAPGDEVKILDLGVSKSQARSGHTRVPTDEFILGTPRYMSPEQARQSSSADFRSDMYSLGATLYHMVTGQPPFPGENLVEVVTRQVAGPAPSPKSLNPRVSSACAHLLEVMMARDPSERHESWEDCVADIGRVMSGHPPLTPTPREHGSMIESSPPSREEGIRIQAEEGRRRVPVVAVLTVLLCVLLVWGVARIRSDSAPAEPSAALTSAPPPPDSDPGPSPKSAHRAELDHRLQELDRQAQDGGSNRDLLRAYRGLADDAWELGEIDIAEQAHRHLSTLRRRQSEEDRATLETLERDTQTMVQGGDYLGAAEYLRTYDGPGSATTVRARLLRAGQLEARALHEAEAAWQSLREKVVDTILDAASLEKALAMMNQARVDPTLAPVRDQVSNLEEEILQAARAPAQVIRSFINDVGTEIDVILLRGPKRLMISDVGPHAVVGVQKLPQGSLNYTFTYRDLAMQEKVSRLAGNESPATQFLLALLAVEAGEISHAIAGFRRSGGGLATALADALQQTD